MHWHEQTHLQILPNRGKLELCNKKKKEKRSISTAHNRLSLGWFKYTSAYFIPYYVPVITALYYRFSTFTVITVFKQHVLSALCKWNLALISDTLKICTILCSKWDLEINPKHRPRYQKRWNNLQPQKWVISSLDLIALSAMWVMRAVRNNI